ncbi:MAG: AAA family ATPase [Desulfobacteraceae bacterium]|nr:AAA family ATPase [Desulfobacteraceae bacterium]MBC2719150.1 AAA family ATPase [Desulfobacteraceae bacterium]
MERDIYSWLKNWKNEKRRKPLIIRGARQVGKTWLVEYFGKKFLNSLLKSILNFSHILKPVFQH